MVSSFNWNMWRLAAAAMAIQAGAGVLAEQKPLHDGAAAKRGKNPFTSSFKTYVESLLDEWKVAGMSIGVVDGDDVFTEVRRCLIITIQLTNTLTKPPFRASDMPSSLISQQPQTPSGTSGQPQRRSWQPQSRTS